MRSGIINKSRGWKLLLVLLAGGVAVSFGGNARAVSHAGGSTASGAVAKTTAFDAAAFFNQYCVACHGATAPKAGVSLERMLAQASVGESFQQWEKVALALEEKSMPPKVMPQPSDAERAQVIAWIRAALREYAQQHDGDPGAVTVRRLTSGEYAWTIKDLTGLDLNVGIDSASDSVGGEGFTNFGDVQFMQDANLERYLAAAKIVADHAVIGAGPLEFFERPGRTGFEMSAVTRIREIYTNYGFRTVSAEGGRPFGLEKYSQAFFVAWQFKHRAVLGEVKASLKELAAREGLTPEFAEHIWQVVNNSVTSYPTSEIIARWRQLPAPGADAKAATTAARNECDAIQKFLVSWPSWLFARGDLAAGGAGDESPLEFSDRTLNVKSPHRFIYVRGGGPFGPPPGPAKIYLHVAPVNPAMGEKPLVIWRNLTVAFRPIIKPRPVAAGESVVVTKEEMEALAALRRGILPPGPRKTLRSVVTPEMAQKLNFGRSPDGTIIGADDFVSEGSILVEVPMPDVPEPMAMNLEVVAELGRQREQVVRIVISDRADGMTRGMPTRALVGDMTTTAYKTFRAGVEQFVTLLPPNSHSEPTPSDRDPIPEPFDNEYNTPEHDEFVQKVKYIREDQFVVMRLLDDATRVQLNHAWHDLYAAFEYHDNYLQMLAKHFNYDLKGKGIAQMDKAAIVTLPAAMQKDVVSLRREYKAAQAAQVAARPGHLKDCLEFASRAWRRPLTEKEKLSLRAFYEKALSAESDHRQALRALLVRILVAPQFLYRVEQMPSEEIGEPHSQGRRANALMHKSAFNSQSSITLPQALRHPQLTNWEMASRLSYFLWASIPDAELRRAASAGELTTTPGIQRQVRRMLADPKARRLSVEFFGQWLGFYHFDEHRGVDTSRFPEFTDAVKEAMYDEAVSFFEHVIRKERPLRELLSADYTFLNQDLAKFYGVKKDIHATDRVEIVTGASEFQRGGLLRLGAVLTVTSAPLRTSPVKRGDWILRRILGTPTPPPPADAGSLPADDKLFGGLTLKVKLEQHKRNTACANCHLRIDPLGFSLERYDSTGRWRNQYADGNAIEDAAALADKTEIKGVDGLLRYLQAKETQVRKNLASKLVGYALGRTVQASDQLLIERMVQAGSDATMTRLVEEIAVSRQFRYRLARAEKPVAPASPTTQKIALNTTPKRQEP